MKAKGIALLCCLTLSGCKFAANQSLSDEGHDADVHGADDESYYRGPVYGAPAGIANGNYDFAAIGAGSGTSAHIAAVASSMLGKENCSLWPLKKFKCAQQASDVLRSAGVPIKGSMAVKGLVAQLRAIGWIDAPMPCKPGQVQHSAGRRPSHVGVVGVDGRPIHNSSSAGSSWRCGRLSNRNYSSWTRQSSCLAPPR
ncbi:MAG TPA: hypothetical protein VM901_13165 [Bdellovibrionota bacterium]|jgi:hypothetical protein|nr:hypothetical protein [Bdellovibrionota bacterium]